MAEKKKWDLTSTHSCEGAAEWLRKGSGAQVVLIVRGKDDWAASVRPDLLPQDACAAVNAVMAELYAMILERKGRGKS